MYKVQSVIHIPAFLSIHRPRSVLLRSMGYPVIYGWGEKWLAVCHGGLGGRCNLKEKHDPINNFRSATTLTKVEVCAKQSELIKY
jgi:hypothetical protein